MAKLLLLAALLSLVRGKGVESDCGLDVYFVVDPSVSGAEFDSISASLDFESSYSVANTSRFRVVAGGFATGAFYKFKSKEECRELIDSVRDNYEGGFGKLNMALMTTHKLLLQDQTSQRPYHDKAKRPTHISFSLPSLSFNNSCRFAEISSSSSSSRKESRRRWTFGES